MFRLFVAAMLVAIFSSSTDPLFAAQPSENLLPQTTKGFLSIPDLNALGDGWQETQLGQMLRDPVMKPFAADLEKQIKGKLSKTDLRLGITFEDLKDVYGGEVSLAVIQPWDEAAAEKAVQSAIEKSVAAARRARKSENQIKEIRTAAELSARADQERKRLAATAMVMLVDITGHKAEIDALLEKVDQELMVRKAAKSAVKIGELDGTSYTLPIEEGEKVARTIVYCLQGDLLIASDKLDVARQIVALAEESDGGALASMPRFAAPMDRCKQAFGDIKPHIRWFVEPFGFAEAMRAYDSRKKRRGTDYLKVLGNQGFKAIQGMGGFVALSTGEYQILHQTHVFAPPVEHAPGEERQGRYHDAANMLDFPNTARSIPPSWIPQKVALMVDFNWRIRQAFEHVGSLVDEIAGDEVFEDVIKSIETDPNGPRINVRKEFVEFLADRALFFTDYRLPIEPQSERVMFAIKVADEKAVMKTVNKAMRSDPAAKKRIHNEHVVWEIFKEDPVEIETVQIDGPGFGFEFEEPEEEEEGFVIPNSAVTVAHGHLLIGSHFDYIVEILDQPEKARNIQDTGDYQQIDQALANLGGGKEESFRFFARTASTYRSTYELLRSGKMPESETIMGKLLNRILAPEEEGELREQEIDGSKLPEFSQIEKYLGPSGFYVKTLADGWSISGCLMAQ